MGSYHWLVCQPIRLWTDGINMAISTFRTLPALFLHLKSSLTGSGVWVLAAGHVVDLHFTPMCTMLPTAAERERHGTHTRALSPLSHRPSHEGWQDQRAHLKHDPTTYSLSSPGVSSHGAHHAVSP